MLTIRCSGEHPEVELAATPAEFERLAKSIAEFATSEAAELLVGTGKSDPRPYERCLSGLRVAKASAPLIASITGASLSVIGSPAALSLFARNLPVESELPPGYHVHFEATGRVEMVSPDTTPLILLVASDPAA